MNLAAGAVAMNAQVLNPKASGGPSPSQKVSSRGSGMTGNGPTPRDSGEPVAEHLCRRDGPLASGSTSTAGSSYSLLITGPNSWNVVPLKRSICICSIGK